MADASKMSIEQILAAARKQDGRGQDVGGQDGGAPESTPPSVESSPAETPPSAAELPEAAPKTTPKTAPSGPSKPAGQMSVAEMMAAARAEKAAAGKAEAVASAPAAATVPTKEASATKAAPAKPAGAMSVAEMMAAARAEKGRAEKVGGAKAAAPAEEAAKPAPEKKLAAEKPAADKPAKAAGAKTVAPAAGPKDTTSILAAARQASKPGPITKAEAAAREPKAVVAKAPAKEKLTAPPMPAKPEYARRPEPAAASSQPTRRGFFAGVAGAVFGSSLAVGFSTLAATNLLWVLGGARFMFPNILTEPPTKFRVGFPGDLAPGQVEEKFKALNGVWIVRYEYEGQQQIFALKSVCTHLGCTPNWLEAEQKFKCPCHGSGFYKDGVNFEGPAPRPLERYAIRKTDDGQLEVDKSRTFLEEKGQWNDAASFVSV
jgi:cytochrome b6-f complex iron-sulfur subunit